MSIEPHILSNWGPTQSITMGPDRSSVSIHHSQNLGWLETFGRKQGWLYPILRDGAFYRPKVVALARQRDKDASHNPSTRGAISLARMFEPASFSSIATASSHTPIAPSGKRSAYRATPQHSSTPDHWAPPDTTHACLNPGPGGGPCKQAREESPISQTKR
jgi:hypothetical protein